VAQTKSCSALNGQWLRAYHMRSDSKRSLQLDVLRGIAVMLVLGRHFEIPRPGGVAGALGEFWFTIGWLGVDVFFVLSGFLIAGLLLAEIQNYGKIDIGRFLIRRGLKLYPAYLAFLAYLIFMPTLKSALAGGDVAGTFVQYTRNIWPNFFFLQNYLGTTAGHTWTLSVEEHFYLLLPFALAALAACGRIEAVISLCIAAVPLFLLLRVLSVLTQDGHHIYMSATHLRMDALLIGVGIRGLAQYRAELFNAFRKRRMALILIGLLCWLPHCFISPATAVIRTIGLTATSVGSAAFLLAAFHTHASDFGAWARFVNPGARLLGWIGIYSYTIYLWHVTTIRILEREFTERLISTMGNGPGTYIASIFVVCSGAILAGVVTARIIEWPVLRLRDRLFPSRTRMLSATVPAERSPVPTTTEIIFDEPPQPLPLGAKTADIAETAL
jgi:peptidoglycan/LPS O-acetylase OafA/YrhL